MRAKGESVSENRVWIRALVTIDTDFFFSKHKNFVVHVPSKKPHHRLPPITALSLTQGSNADRPSDYKRARMNPTKTAEGTVNLIRKATATLNL
jgi:hypothetical protein